jgi:hypothetical protein
MLFSKDDFIPALRGSDVRTALHGFAQDPGAPLPASLQQLVDELVRDANRTRITISSRRAGKSALMAETARQMAAKTDEFVSKGKSGGFVVVPCPWGKESGRETFYPADYLPMSDPRKKPKSLRLTLSLGM